jgi:hypothetical protein
MISMTISRTHLLSEIAAGHDGPTIPPAKRAYFQERLRGRVFDFIVSRFEREQGSGLNKAKLGRRIGKAPEIINRLLGAPSNLTLDTISDLLIGISGEEPDLSASPVLRRAPVNYSHIDELANETKQDIGERASAKATIEKPQTRTDNASATDRSIGQEKNKKSVLCE